MDIEIVECPLIASPGEAAEWFNRRDTGERLAFDLEADGLYSYEDKICLSQVASGGRVALLDPLGGAEVLAPFLRALADPGIAKIAHGSDYDVRLLKKCAGVGPVNLFDTMIAAQLLGYERLGLAALLEIHFGVVLDKRHQRADWSKRPLTESMLDYAASDVTRLEPLADILTARLVEMGRLAWAEEEFKILEGVRPSPPKAPNCFDVKGSQKLEPGQLAVLQALLELRDDAARKKDRPPFKILSTETLVEWAKNPPRTKAEVLSTRGVSRPAMERLAQGIIETVEAALALPPEALPQRLRAQPRAQATAEEQKRLERLKTARTQGAARLGLDPGIIVNTPTLERLSRSALEEAPGFIETELKRWQREVIGGELLDALQTGC